MNFYKIMILAIAFSAKALCANAQEVQDRKILHQRITTHLFEKVQKPLTDDAVIGELFAELEPQFGNNPSFFDVLTETIADFNTLVTLIQSFDPSTLRDFLILGAIPSDQSILLDPSLKRTGLIASADFLDCQPCDAFPALLQQVVARHFIHADLNDESTHSAPSFTSVANERNQYKTIMFDWCVSNRVLTKETQYASQTIRRSVLINIFKLLKEDGDLFFSDVYEDDLKIFSKQLTEFGFNIRNLELNELPENYRAAIFTPTISKGKRYLIAKKPSLSEFIGKIYMTIQGEHSIILHAQAAEIAQLYRLDEGSIHQAIEETIHLYNPEA